ncbi:PAS domain S-box protein [Opitutus sp. ER46]|uniref:hybrid sensor histidine kinase/response regulator n=1 Tax=Opitutus sp. ER46 TaxID=2161864 RepID=UPI000D30E7BC|nr:PAS domain S-box protein [Opitutus sp. ER46]PTX91473.1 hypothetical protein DB354_16420 [Opitutus sp. ER46]
MSARSLSKPLKLTLAYAAAGIAWVFVTEVLLESAVEDLYRSIAFDAFKEFLFIGITAGLLYVWARRFYSGTIEETEALTLARVRAEQTRRMYATVTAVNHRIIRPTDTVALCQAICDALLEPGGFCAAWIGRSNSAESVTVSIAHAGPPPPSAITAAELAVDPDLARVVDTLRLGRPVSLQQLGPRAGELASMRQRCGAKSLAAIPFRPAGSAPMALIVYSDAAGYFTPDILGMLNELTADLEFGIEALAEKDLRAAAEAALRSSEERYRLVAENSQDVIWVIGFDATLQYVSPAIERLLGYTPAQCFKLRPSEIFTPDSIGAFDDLLRETREAVERNQPISTRLLEVQQRRADGSTVWTEMRVSEFHDANGRLTGLLGVTRDITQRRVIDQALASEVARYRALMDVSVDAIHLLDGDGRLIEANDTFLRQRGFSRSDIGQLCLEDWTIDPGDDLRRRLSQIGVRPVRVETRHRRRNGSTFDVEVVTVALELHGRRVTCASARDITERKDFEKRLLRAQRLESVGLIASGIAHDLNNVLTPILLSTGLLEMRYRSPEDAQLLKPIEAAARRGSSIVQQILTFSRGAEGQRLAIEPKILLKELSSIIRETFPRNIVHKLEIAADARPVVGDPTQLHQVFLNLALNARDAMPQGGTLTIGARNHHITAEDLLRIPSAVEGEYVCISVVDTGTGITPDVLDHLFEPFFTTKPRGRGTGLGLSTVHGLVRGHGGFVDVSSQLGHGSEFRVFLPSAGPESTPAPAAGANSHRKIGQGEHVLVVDDELAILTVLSSVLRRAGFTVHTAADGAEALQELELRPTDIRVVITDIMMPKFDGIRLTSEVRQRYPKLPVIAMSGMISPTSDDESREQLRALGVTTVLDKPYGEPELLDAIAAALKATNAPA